MSTIFPLTVVNHREKPMESFYFRNYNDLTSHTFFRGTRTPGQLGASKGFVRGWIKSTWVIPLLHPFQMPHCCSSAGISLGIGCHGPVVGFFHLWGSCKSGTYFIEQLVGQCFELQLVSASFIRASIMGSLVELFCCAQIACCIQQRVRKRIIVVS